jgi:hypothetical protein
MNQEQRHCLRHWLGLLPRDEVENDPPALVIKAWLLIGRGEVAAVAA